MMRSAVPMRTAVDSGIVASLVQCECHIMNDKGVAVISFDSAVEFLLTLLRVGCYMMITNP